ncbi:beta-fructofuranosidase, soluble isoenzyme I-like protein [Tanacetum coccineum]
MLPAFLLHSLVTACDKELANMLSCGDDGRIRRWKWMDVMEAKQDGLSKSGDLKAHLDMANPESHKCFKHGCSGGISSLGGLSPIPETNAMAVDGGSGFAGAGDSEKYRISLDYDGERVVYGSTVPVLDGEELTLRLLVIDPSIVEGFVQGGRTIITSRVYLTKEIYEGAKVYLFNNATSTSVKASLKIGQMAPVEIQPYPS